MEIRSGTADMRLLIVWAESVNRPTGGSGHFWGLLDGLSAAGCNIRAVCPRYGLAAVPHSPHVRYLPLPPRSLFTFLLLQVWLLIAMPWYLLRHRPDVVYQRTWFLSFLARPLLWIAGVKLLMEIDAVVDEETRMRGQCRILAAAVRLLERLSFRFADGLVCVTEGIRNDVVRRGARPDKTAVIHNAARITSTPPLDLQNARRALGLPTEARIVGFAGTFAPWQGLDLLVDAALGIIAGCPEPVIFVLMGEGQMNDELRRHIAAARLTEQFIFLPPAGHEKVTILHAACDAVVIPIHDERKLRYGISPLKFWDAVSVGTPVIVPAGSELEVFLSRLRLPGVFEPSDTDDFTQKVLSALDQSEVCQSRRAEIRRIVQEEYSWRNAALKLMRFAASLRASHDSN